ncbi:MAG: protein RarD [Leifsonia sp.]|nr:protein RarD [Leifsonia sp.]
MVLVPPSLAPENARRRGTGLAYVISAYALWGTFPLYFLLFAPASALEVVGFRIVLSFVFCLLLITVFRRWRAILGLVRQPRVVGAMALAGIFIYVNWLVYVFAVLNDQVVEASLGYFINPLVTVLLGVFMLRESLRPAQWVAVGVSAIAVLVIAIGYGTFPVISLVLAASFGMYGYVKSRVGAQVDALSGLTIETTALAPFALAQLFVLGSTAGLAFGQHGVGQAVAMLSAGVVTAVPLLMFAAGTRRLPLVAVGLAQYLTPVLQFVIGVAILGEPMPLERWIGFALVWVALLILSVDMVRAGRASRRASAPPL